MPKKNIRILKTLQTPNDIFHSVKSLVEIIMIYI